MALPLLPIAGLLAAGAGQAFLPGMLEDQRARGRGRRFQNSGADFSSLGMAGQQAQLLGNAGILQEHGNIVNQMFGQQQADAANATSLERSRISAGVGYARLAMEKEQLQLQAEAAQAEKQAAIEVFGMTEAEYAIPSIRAQAYQNYGVNADNVRMMGMTDDQQMRALALERLQQDADAAEASRTINADAIARQAEITAAREEYGTLQYDVDQRTAQIQEAINAVPQASFGPQMNLSANEMKANRVINKVMTELGMEFWNKDLGRSDAPSEAEVAGIKDKFPEVTTQWINNHNRGELIDYVLKEALGAQYQKLDDAEASYQRRGLWQGMGYQRPDRGTVTFTEKN